MIVTEPIFANLALVGQTVLQNSHTDNFFKNFGAGIIFLILAPPVYKM